MKTYTGNYILSWTDQNGNDDSKVYSDYSTTLKAKKWLIDNKADNIDISIELKDSAVASPEPVSDVLN